MRTITCTHPLQAFSQSPVFLKKNPSFSCLHGSLLHPSFHFFAPKALQKGFKTCCISPRQELINNHFRNNPSYISKIEEEKEEGEEKEKEEMEGKSAWLGNQSTWNKMMEVLKFTGPAAGLWICAPLMSLIDTAVIGQGSSIELAALGPATVICDYVTHLFMFLSIATSNMVATSLARQVYFPGKLENALQAAGGAAHGMMALTIDQALPLSFVLDLAWSNKSFQSFDWMALVQDKNEVQHQISVLLSVGLTCGILMLLLTRAFGLWALTAFTGPKNVHIVPAANIYVQIRSVAWPAVLVGSIAQSASLGMKDSWGPLKALVVASAINGVGDVVLCCFLGYGIAGAAWATMVSQAVAAYMMINSLNKKGYNAFAFSAPSADELVKIFGLAGPVFLTLMSKVAFHALIIYFATSMGAHCVAAHQVMIQTCNMFAVWGEPLSQTAQSFMPELMYGVNKSLKKARELLKSLVIVGAALGLILGIIGTIVPWLFPNIFTHDQKVIQEMHRVLILYFFALVMTPCINSLEGTLLAGRDLKFIGLSMSGCFSLGALVLLLVRSKGYGLPGCWCAILGFQGARFLLSLWRLLSPDGILFSEDLSRSEMQQLKAA